MLPKIIFIILLIDSIAANIVAVFGARWYARHFQTISRMFPITIAWTIWYLILVLWIGVVTWGMI